MFMHLKLPLQLPGSFAACDCLRPPLACFDLGMSLRSAHAACCSISRSRCGLARGWPWLTPAAMHMPMVGGRQGGRGGRGGCWPVQAQEPARRCRQQVAPASLSLPCSCMQHARRGHGSAAASIAELRAGWAGGAREQGRACVHAACEGGGSRPRGMRASWLQPGPPVQRRVAACSTRASARMLEARRAAGHHRA